MRNERYLLSKGAYYNTPAQHWVEEGWFEVVTAHTIQGDVVMVTRLTPKGLANLTEIYMSDYNDIPRKRRRKR